MPPSPPASPALSPVRRNSASSWDTVHSRPAGQAAPPGTGGWVPLSSSMRSAEGSTALVAIHRTKECSRMISNTWRCSSAARGLRRLPPPTAACVGARAAGTLPGCMPPAHAARMAAAAAAGPALGDGVGDSTFCSARLHGAGGGVSRSTLPPPLPLPPPGHPLEPPVCWPVSGSGCGCGCGAVASAPRGAAAAAATQSKACLLCSSAASICCKVEIRFRAALCSDRQLF